ncbi:DUF992 domain-containing protein [Labrys okinawensis]|uniref:DUF992 domain-containing protein n=1 Tax=Labrys okinawensis TaxID=346911 RepID=UPI0039BD474C
MMKTSKRKLFWHICIVTGAMAAGVTFAHAEARRVHTGTLTCKVGAGIGLIVTSKKDLDCVFRAAKHHPERYVGHIQKFGLDIGVTKVGTIAWGVFEAGPHRTDLGGTYVGATAEATFAAGLGANVLIGGSGKSIALQPLSVSGQTGLNIAAGVGQISLQKAP